ncbi:fragment of putative glutathione S-transferase (part 2) [Bradyrhizobium sp. ORS 285]|nr:fragment of putative glutathione S-transferase (part 2) [Bradyrhizobium sp. ORS 285]SMX58668.1 fragment of putative glutathione S-transferase (part 2) [Bradyrhizobium sp. ORS 285]
MARPRRAPGHRSHVEAESFTLADLALGAYARRWFGVEGVEKPELPNLTRWYERIAQRPAFIRHIAPPLS